MDFARDNLHEILIMSSINNKNILKVLGISIDSNFCFIMELCQTDLNEWVKKYPFNKVDILKILIGICNGLEELHKKDLAHRDLKPANIMIKDGEIKVGDLGLVSRIRRHDREHGMIGHSIMTTKAPLPGVGTLLYMSPEAVHRKIGTSADVWATACIALYTITQTDPYVQEI